MIGYELICLCEQEPPTPPEDFMLLRFAGDQVPADDLGFDIFSPIKWSQFLNNQGSMGVDFTAVEIQGNEAKLYGNLDKIAYLVADGANITYADLSKLPGLEKLSMLYNLMESNSTTVLANPVLHPATPAQLLELSLAGNPLAIDNFNATTYPLLQTLNLNGCGLTGFLDVRDLDTLYQLEAESNNLSAVRLSGNADLTYFRAPFNQIEEIDLSECNSLMYCDLSSNLLTSAITTGNYYLQTLLLQDCQLEDGGLDFSNNPLLYRVQLDRNSAITGLPELQSLYHNSETYITAQQCSLTKKFILEYLTYIEVEECTFELIDFTHADNHDFSDELFIMQRAHHLRIGQGGLRIMALQGPEPEMHVLFANSSAVYMALGITDAWSASQWSAALQSYKGLPYYTGIQSVHIDGDLHIFKGDFENANYMYFPDLGVRRFSIPYSIKDGEIAVRNGVADYRENSMPIFLDLDMSGNECAAFELDRILEMLVENSIANAVIDIRGLYAPGAAGMAAIAVLEGRGNIISYNL